MWTMRKIGTSRLVSKQHLGVVILYPNLLSMTFRLRQMYLYLNRLVRTAFWIYSFPCYIDRLKISQYSFCRQKQCEQRSGRKRRAFSKMVGNRLSDRKTNNFKLFKNWNVLEGHGETKNDKIIQNHFHPHIAFELPFLGKQSVLFDLYTSSHSNSSNKPTFPIPRWRLFFSNHFLLCV